MNIIRKKVLRKLAPGAKADEYRVPTAPNGPTQKLNLLMS